MTDEVQQVVLWQLVWRAAAKAISTRGLKALLKALKEDDPRLIQGNTTRPPPIQSQINKPVEAACGISYCGWKGDGLESVAEVEDYFARMCFEADKALGGPAASRWFLNTFDEWDRSEMRQKMIPEVELELSRRKGGGA